DERQVEHRSGRSRMPTRLRTEPANVRLRTEPANVRLQTPSPQHTPRTSHGSVTPRHSDDDDEDEDEDDDDQDPDVDDDDDDEVDSVADSGSQASEPDSGVLKLGRLNEPRHMSKHDLQVAKRTELTKIERLRTKGFQPCKKFT